MRARLMLEVDGRAQVEVMAFTAHPFHERWPMTFDAGPWDIKRAVLQALNREARAVSAEIMGAVDTDEDEAAELAGWQRSEEDRVAAAEQEADFRREGA